MFNGYLKPGPGVEKDAPKKKGIFLYFEILFRKFTRLMQANIIYILTSLPWIVLLYLFASFSTYDLTHNLASGLNMAGDGLSGGDIEGMLQLMFRCIFMSVVLVLWGSGPSSAGYSYITRCFTHEQHAWIWTDFKDKFKENFKQSIIIVIIDAVVLVLAANAVMFYMSMYKASGEFIWLLMNYIMLLALLVYSWAHFYVYQIMVTIQCKTMQLYKNAFMLALGKMPMNLLLTVISAGLMILMYVVFGNPLLAMIATLVVWFSVARFPIEFYAARTIDKIVQNMPKNPVPKYFDDEEEEK